MMGMTTDCIGHYGEQKHVLRSSDAVENWEVVVVVVVPWEGIGWHGTHDTA